MTCRQIGDSFSGWKGAAYLAALFVFLFSSAWAQDDDIQLALPDSDFAVSGRFLGFDGQFVRVETPAGEVTLAYDSLTCVGAACPDANFVPIVRFSGSQRIGQLIMPPLIEAYARDVGATVAIARRIDGVVTFQFHSVDSGKGLMQIVVRSTTSADGFADLVASEADIVMSAREVTAAELALAREAGLGQLDRQGRSRIIALDALVPVVSPETGLAQISLENVSRIFAGEVTNWADIGGSDAAIALHLLPDWLGQMQGFQARVLAPAGRTVSSDVQRHATPEGLAAALMNDPRGFGVLPFGALGDTQPMRLVGSCGIGVAARLMTLKTEDYPLTMPLFLYLPARRLHPEVDAFLGWLRRPSAQLVIRRAGFVDQTAIAIPVAQQGDRFAQAITAAGAEVPLAELQRMVRILGPQVRLSTTFRFEVGSTRLDAQSRSNVLQLARDIRDGRHDGHVLMLVGFSDGRGPANANRDLSSARAQAVRRAVIAALEPGLPPQVSLETEAFGEALPMACDDTLWGQQTNRRVELWVADRR